MDSNINYEKKYIKYKKKYLDLKQELEGGKGFAVKAITQAAKQTATATTQATIRSATKAAIQVTQATIITPDMKKNLLKKILYISDFDNLTKETKEDFVNKIYKIIEKEKNNKNIDIIINKIYNDKDLRKNINVKYINKLKEILIKKKDDLSKILKILNS